MTSDQHDRRALPSVGAITIGLVLCYVMVSLAIAFVAGLSGAGLQQWSAALLAVN